MSFFSDLLDKFKAFLLGKLLDVLKPVIAPFKALFSLIEQFTTKTTSIFATMTTIFTEASTEYQAIKDFQMKDNWRSRVISVPVAIDTAKRLSDVPGQLVAAFKDLIQQLRESFPEQATEADLEDLVEGGGDLEEFVGKLGGKLGEVAEKLLGWAALIIQALTQIEAALDDIKTILDAVKEVRQDIENFDGFFLGQTNARVKVDATLPDGSKKSLNLRAGALHKDL